MYLAKVLYLISLNSSSIPIPFHCISVLFLSHSCGFLRIPADSGAIPEDSSAIPEDSWGFLWIPVDSWGFLQEWEGHCKVLVLMCTLLVTLTVACLVSVCELAWSLMCTLLVTLTVAHLVQEVSCCGFNVHSFGDTDCGLSSSYSELA